MKTWRLASLICFPLLAGCEKPTVCTTQVTEGNGTFTGVAEGTRPQPDLEREALHAACTKLCAAAATTEACVSRCAVDVVAAKIGAHTTCSKGNR